MIVDSTVAVVATVSEFWKARIRSALSRTMPNQRVLNPVQIVAC
jgi:hypothetical protein